MDISLYISNEKLIAATGSATAKRLTVQSCTSAPLPSGSVINGIVTNEAGFTEAFQTLSEALRGKPRGVRLVLNSSQFYVKRSIMPKLPKKKLVDIVKDEFADIDSEGDDLIYDCMVLGDNPSEQGSVVFACAARQSLVASYAELFRTLGVKITCLDTTHAALIKLIGLLFDEPRTFVTLALDGNMLDATLFVNNEFRLNNRTRLMAERGTAECGAEVSRLVSSLIQFNSSERSGQSIGGVYVIGAQENEAGLMKSLTAAYDIPAAPLEDERGVIHAPESGFTLAEYAFAAGNLIVT